MLQWFYKMKQALQEKLSEKGQGMVEYALVLAAVAIIAAVVLSDKAGGLRDSVSNAYSNAGTQINSANTAVGGSTQSGGGGGGGGGGGSGGV